MSGGLTPGDPLGGDEPRADPPRRPDEPLWSGSPSAPEAPAAPPPRPEAPPASGGYGGGRVPPGAFAPRGREEVADPYADAQPAEWWRRFAALILDGVIVWVIGAMLIGIVLASIGAFDDDTTGVAAAVVTALVAIGAVTVGALVYAPAMMASTNGKTLGKMAFGLRVVRSDGRRIDFAWAALREVLVKALALGVAGAATGGIAYLVDGLWPFFDDRKRALHDIAVDSRVVRD